MELSMHGIHQNTIHKAWGGGYILAHMMKYQLGQLKYVFVRCLSLFQLCCLKEVCYFFSLLRYKYMD